MMAKRALGAGIAALLTACAVPSAPLPPVRLILVGDSTLAPHNGYGDVLCKRFIAQVTCINLARNGRSSASYRADGSWQKVQTLLADGSASKRSYVLIEFGHNDQPGKPGRSTNLTTEFPVNLARYIDEVRASGGTPVLVTPLTRRSFQADLLVNDLQPWAQADRSVATARKVPLVDLLAASAAAVQAMGSAQADTLAVEPPPPAMAEAQTDLNQVEAVTNKKSAFDHTHVGAKGAAFFAAIVEQLLRRDVQELTPYFKAEDEIR